MKHRINRAVSLLFMTIFIGSLLAAPAATGYHVWSHQVGTHALTTSLALK